MPTPGQDEAPLCVPVELRRHGEDPAAPRWFRLAVAISPAGLLLRSPLPQELREGPVDLRLHLPLLPPGAPEPGPAAPGQVAGPAPLSLTAVAGPPEGEDEEALGPRRLLFRGLSEAQRQPLRRYALARTGP